MPSRMYKKLIIISAIAWHIDNLKHFSHHVYIFPDVKFHFTFQHISVLYTLGRTRCLYERLCCKLLFCGCDTGNKVPTSNQGCPCSSGHK